MKAYLALTRVTARVALTYRLQFALSVVAMIFQLAAMLAVWRVLLADRPLAGFDLPRMRAYLMVGFAASVIVSVYADFRMSFRIRHGLVALDLVKPVDYQWARFAETLGGVWVELVMVGVVCGGVVAVGGGVPVPSAPYLGLFALSMSLLVPLKFLLVYASGLVCFWTKNFLGVQWARLAIVNLLSGAMIPFAFFPDWLGSLATWLPFAGVTSTPGLIFIGHVRGARAVLLVGAQLAWVGALWAGARLVWRAALRQLTVHGG